MFAKDTEKHNLSIKCEKNIKIQMRLQKSKEFIHSLPKIIKVGVTQKKPTQEICYRIGINCI